MIRYHTSFTSNMRDQLQASTHPLQARTHPLQARTHSPQARTHPLQARTHPLQARTFPGFPLAHRPRTAHQQISPTSGARFHEAANDRAWLMDEHWKLTDGKVPLPVSIEAEAFHADGT